MSSIESKKLLVEVSICQNVLGLLIMRCLVKTCSQTVQVTSALQRMFPLTLYFDIHSINVSMYLCNCNQIATAMCIPHITWTMYLHIIIRTVHICTAACICTLYGIFTTRHDNGTRDNDVNGKPTVKNMSTRMMSFSIYVVSDQHWAYSWLAYPLYFTHCLASSFCKFT